MKKSIILVFLAAALLLAACGAQPAATDQPAQESEASSSSESQSDMDDVSDMSSSAPAPTAMPTPSEAPAASADGKVPVRIVLGDNWIQSDLTTFKVGQTYVFTITNSGNRVHNFNINPPAAELTTSAIKIALENALLSVPDEQLGPTKTVVVEYTFTKPAAAGELEFSCMIDRHYKSGQVLPIIVEP